MTGPLEKRDLLEWGGCSKLLPAGGGGPSIARFPDAFQVNPNSRWWLFKFLDLAVNSNIKGFSAGASGKELARQCRKTRETWVQSLGWEGPNQPEGGRNWNGTVHVKCPPPRFKPSPAMCHLCDVRQVAWPLCALVSLSETCRNNNVPSPTIESSWGLSKVSTGVTVESAWYVKHCVSIVFSKWVRLCFSELLGKASAWI